MKVGTDGILLGAWAGGSRPDRILDIGSGTGLIALMLAQRFNEAEVDAVEIDASASAQCVENFFHSPWSHRLTLFPGDINAVCREQLADRKYSLIVSNPPWFRDCLKSDDLPRNTARHTDALGTEDLLHAAGDLLSPDGRLVVILPYDQGICFMATALQYGLHRSRQCDVYPDVAKSAKRMLLEFSREPAGASPGTERLVIENSQRHDYTAEFRALTKAFYLRF